MKRSLFLSVVAASLMPLGGGIVLAQGTPQTLSVLKIDVTKVATGYRATKILGQNVVNDAGDTVGKIDDMIVTDGKVPFLILSVGGFLGVGTKLVAVPYETLKIADKKLLLPG